MKNTFLNIFLLLTLLIFVSGGSSFTFGRTDKIVLHCNAEGKVGYKFPERQNEIPNVNMTASVKTYPRITQDSISVKTAPFATVTISIINP